ncbi:MAG: sulfatase-like hydrolase/transferase [Acidobacteria bacterium]|nr:sulfatase-like hydrolase/transferase [Acidobacteriota bacterium]
MKTTRRSLIAGLAGAPMVSIAGRAAASRPNVVMFMTDDHGAWATGTYGCGGMRTPNIDRLAEGGARFNRAFACTPVCSPSRVTYLTGTLPSHHGVQEYLTEEDSHGPGSHRWYQGLTTYSEVLAKNGYDCGMSGKWHMGEDDKAQAGFKFWATVPGGGGPYRNQEFVKNGVRMKPEGFKTDIMTDYALEFLDQSRQDPFYLLMPYYAPHRPYEYQPEEDRQWYKDSAFSCFPDTKMHPWQIKSHAMHHGDRASKLAYSALVTGVDRSVGRVLKRLEELKLRENTLVIFTADQGWNAGHHGVWGKGNGTWPFNLYEESLRVPLIWNHPGRIRAGMRPNQLVSAYDYFPTLLEYLGLKAGPDSRRVGHRYAPILKGQSPAWRDRLYFEYSSVRGVRTDTAKFVERTSEWPSEMFDLERDPGETASVLDDPARRLQAAALKQDLDRFFAQAGAPPIAQWRQTTKQKLATYTRAKP